MSLQRAVGNGRVVEIADRIMAHTQALHDADRPDVDRRGEGDDLVAVELFKAEGQRRDGGFSRVAVAPVATVQPPSDLDRRREVCVKAGTAEPDKTDEGGVIGHLYRP